MGGRAPGCPHTFPALARQPPFSSEEDRPQDKTGARAQQVRASGKQRDWKQSLAFTPFLHLRREDFIYGHLTNFCLFLAHINVF